MQSVSTTLYGVMAKSRSLSSQILSMMSIIYSVRISCRRSSPFLNIILWFAPPSSEFPSTISSGLLADVKTPIFSIKNSVAMNFGSTGVVNRTGMHSCTTANYSLARLFISSYVIPRDLNSFYFSFFLVTLSDTDYSPALICF